MIRNILFLAFFVGMSTACSTLNDEVADDTVTSAEVGVERLEDLYQLLLEPAPSGAGA